MNVPQKVIDLCSMLDQKKATNILICNTTKMKNVADYVLIASAVDSAHIRDICTFIEEETKKNPEEFESMVKEGFNLSKWVVLAFDRVFVEIFTQPERKRYNLEKLLNEGGNIKTYRRLKKALENEKKRKILREKIEARRAKIKAKIQKIKKVNTKKTESKKEDSKKNKRKFLVGNRGTGNSKK